MKYGEMILGERSRRRITQDEVCNRVGIQRSTLVDIERNRIDITEPTCGKIMEAIEQIADERSNTEAVA